MISKFNIPMLRKFTLTDVEKEDDHDGDIYVITFKASESSSFSLAFNIILEHQGYDYINKAKAILNAYLMDKNILQSVQNGFGDTHVRLVEKAHIYLAQNTHNSTILFYPLEIFVDNNDSARNVNIGYATGAIQLNRYYLSFVATSRTGIEEPTEKYLLTWLNAFIECN